MWSAKRTAALIVFCALDMLAAGVAQAQKCSSMAWAAPAQACPSIEGQVSTPWVDADGLLPPCHNPASVPPADKPQIESPGDLKPAVPMSPQMCKAIRLFDAAPDSERNYDLVNCLDGLTFGFGNWPQGEVGEFFKKLVKDPKAESALVARFLAVFKMQPAAWDSFRRDAQLEDAQADAVIIRTGIQRLLVSAKLPSKRGLKNKKSDGSCDLKPGSTLAPNISFYFDHAQWLVPALQRAFRDPAVVAFQVRYWEEDVLQQATQYAKAFGLPEDGVFLMAFYESNPGQLPSLQPAIKAETPPKTLRAGGQDWQWDGSNRPSALAGISIDRWHTLLICQAMCPAGSDKGFRIRNRNLKFFSEYLAKDFRVPIETKPRRPSEKHPENCDPTRVRIRANIGG